MKHHPDTECPNCGNAMRLAHTVPKFGGLPELQSFRCFYCNEVLTVAIAEAQGASTATEP
jgi:transposase-like protein